MNILKALFWFEILISVLLIISPFIFNYASSSLALWDNIIIGLVIGIISLIGIFGKIN